MNAYKNSFSGKGVFPPKYAFTLLIPLRNIFLSPKKLIQRLHLEQHHQVLEIGPGPGYFSPHLAKALKQGRLLVLDIQQAMLDLCKKRCDKRKLTNVNYQLSDGKHFPVESQSIDRIVMVTVIGEVENKALYLDEIHRVLKSDGLLSISEQAGDPDKLSQEQLQILATAHGFVVDEIFGSRRNFSINFKKRSA